MQDSREPRAKARDATREILRTDPPAHAPARRRSAVAVAAKALTLAVGVVVLSFTFRHVDLSSTWGLLTSAGPAVLLILLPFAAGTALDTLAWRGLFLNLERRLSYWPLLAVRISSEAMVMSVTGGAVLSEGVAPVVLKRRLGVPMAETIATATIRRVLIALAQSFYLGMGAVAGSKFLESVALRLTGHESLGALTIGLASALLVGSSLALAVLLQGQVSARLHALLARVARVKTRAWLERIEHGFLATDIHFANTLRTARSAISALSLFLVAWIVESFETYLILRFIGVDVSFVAVWAFEPLVSLLRHAMFFVPAGLGVQEAGYLVFLSGLGVPDPVTTGAAFAVLKRTKEIFFIILGFAVLAAMSHGAPDPQAEAV